MRHSFALRQVVLLYGVAFLAMGLFSCTGSSLSNANRVRNESSATVAASRPQKWWQDLHNSLKARAKDSDSKLIFVGDSITMGMEDAQDLLDKYWGKFKPAVFGIGGDTTEIVLWRVQNGEFNGLTPRLLVLLIGTNNLGRDGDEDIIRGVEADVDALKASLPKSKILVLGVTPRGREPESDLRKRIVNINKGISMLADGKQVFYIDARDKLTEPDGTISRDVMPDYLHFSHLGYEKLFGAIKPDVDRLLSAPY